jgi:hypothetical protein
LSDLQTAARESFVVANRPFALSFVLQREFASTTFGSGIQSISQSADAGGVAADEVAIYCPWIRVEIYEPNICLGKEFGLKTAIHLSAKGFISLEKITHSLRGV